MSERFLVAVVDIETDEVVKTIEVFNARTASKVRDGMEINLNHNRYEVRICSLDDGNNQA